VATTSVVNVDDARVAYRLRGRDPAVGAMCQQIGAGHLAYFEGADEFLSLATEFLRRHDV